jgi:hypothetical protein
MTMRGKTTRNKSDKPLVNQVRNILNESKRKNWPASRVIDEVNHVLSIDIKKRYGLTYKDGRLHEDSPSL